MKTPSLAIAFTIGLASFAGAEDTEVTSLDAFSVLSAEGTLIQTGTNTLTFAGEMHGPYFIDLGEGPIPAGHLTCVGALSSDDSTGSQSAAANCRFEANDGAIAYGNFQCSGYRFVGCAGPFQLTGGEGRLSGVSGEGEIVLRRYETALVSTDKGEAREFSLGIASWKNLTVREAQ